MKTSGEALALRELKRMFEEGRGEGIANYLKHGQIFKCEEEDLDMVKELVAKQEWSSMLVFLLFDCRVSTAIQTESHFII